MFARPANAGALATWRRTRQRTPIIDSLPRAAYTPAPSGFRQSRRRGARSQHDREARRTVVSAADDELASAALEVAAGPETGRRLPLEKATTTLGRAPGNTHVVADTTISRQHAKVFVRDGRHWIADLNSSHGTFVNGLRITLQTLTSGDEVKLGTTVLRYVAGAS